LATRTGYSKKGHLGFRIHPHTRRKKNAIRAASFAWGYENAARYVDNAMKLMM